MAPHPKVTVPSGSHLTLWLLLSGDLPHLSDLSIDTALHLEESTLESVVVDLCLNNCLEVVLYPLYIPVAYFSYLLLTFFSVLFNAFSSHCQLVLIDFHHCVHCELQWNLAKRGMKISDPIFPIEMDLAKRGIFLQLKWNIKLYFFDFGSW